MKSKFTSMLLVCIILFTTLSGTEMVLADETSGNCGAAAMWSFDAETGKLSITGSGATEDYEKYPEFNAIPWKAHKDSIKTVFVDEGITYIGDNAFKGFENITVVQLPEEGLSFGSSVFSGCKTLKTINLPKTLEVIAEHLLWGCEAIETITVPENVKKIEQGAFGHCEGLSSITLPANLEEIGSSAFTDCYELQNIDIPDSVKKMDSGVFYRCYKLQEIELSENLTSISDYTFNNCYDLETVYFGANVTDIGYRAFYGCDKLNKINVSEDNKFYSSDSFGVLFDKSKTTLKLFPMGRTGGYTVPESVKNISAKAFAYAMVESVTITGELTEIESEAFLCCSELLEIILPDSVKIIDNKAFYGCGKLVNLNMPENLEGIGVEAFYGCESLREINISEKVSSIGDKAFDGCYFMAAINVDEENKFFSSDNGVLYNKEKTALIKMPTFYDAKEYKIADTTCRINPYAFNECAFLESITIPLSVAVFEDFAFEDIGNIRDIYYLGTAEDWGKIYKGEGSYVLNYKTIHYITDDIRSGKTASSEWKVNLYDGYFEVGIDDMENYSLASPAPWYEFADKINTITVGCYEIGNFAFYGCENVTEVTIYNDFSRFRRIGESAFENCKNITKITICENVTAINERTFAGCENLKTVVIEGNITSVAKNAFYGCDSLENVIVPQSEEEWEELSPAIGEGNEAFENALNFYVDPRELSGICGPDLNWEFEKSTGVLKITGSGEMYDYTLHYDLPWTKWKNDVKSILLPDGLTKISRNAFYGFTEITSCELPDSVTEIGDDAFHYCQKLKRIEIPMGVEKISSGCFQGCAALEEVILPETVKKLENDAFEGCVSLKDIEIDAVTEIGVAVFSNCDSFTRFDIPENVVSVGHNIFEYCDNLEYVTIPASVTNMGDTLFSEARKLKSIDVDKNNANYCSVDGVLYSKDMSVLICHPGGKKGEYKIPETVSILRRKCFDGYFEDTIKIPSSVIDIEDEAFPFSTFTDIYYSGSEQEWDEITIGVGNGCLMDKSIIHFGAANMWPFTKTLVEAVGNITEFTVSTECVPENSRVILACYKNGTLVEFRQKVFTADTLTFSTDKEFTFVKVLVWENIGSNAEPVCAAEEIYN